MKHILPILFLAVLSLSCDCGDDSPSDFEPSALGGRWKLSQKVFEGNLQASPRNIEIHFNNDGTYTRYDNASPFCTGTYSLEGKRLEMVSADCENSVADVPMLTRNTLALQLQYDADGDGDVESVRETFTR